MHHYIEDVGQSVKSIRDAVLKATEHHNCEAFVPFTADSPHSDIDRATSQSNYPTELWCRFPVVMRHHHGCVERIKITAYVRTFRINSVLHVPTSGGHAQGYQRAVQSRRTDEPSQPL